MMRLPTHVLKKCAGVPIAGACALGTAGGESAGGGGGGGGDSDIVYDLSDSKGSICIR